MKLLNKVLHLSVGICFLIPVTPAFADDINGSMTFDGKNRTYLLHIPTGYNASTPTPLVFVFHGLTVTGTMMSNITDFSPLADQEKFLVVYPDGLNEKWSSPNTSTDDVGFISALIDLLSDSYNVDADRIFAAGASNGGMFTYRLGLELTDRFAAIASVAGYLPNYGPSPAPVPSKPISVVHFHGTTDLIIPYVEAEECADYWVDFNNCSLLPITLQLPNIDITDGTTVEEMIYANGSDKTEVNLYKIYNGAHTWPGSGGNAVCKDISASEIIWQFFKNHAQNAPPSVSFTKPTSIQFTAPATIHIKATAVDANGSIKNVEFFNGTNSLKKDISSQYSYTWNNVPAGSYKIIAVAKDNEGATAADTINVIVKPQKTLPDNSGTNSIQAFYDPSSQQFTINKMDDMISDYDFFLYDIYGRQIISLQNINDLQKIISTSALDGGIYLYVIKIKQDHSLKGKFIVTR